MIVCGHQPNYMPYGGFFQKIVLSDVFVIVDNVQFVKRGHFGWIHRNRIRANNNQGWLWLTIPVITKNRFFQDIKDTMIDNTKNWQKKHWHSIQWHYHKSPFFNTYAPIIKSFYERHENSLASFNIHIIKTLMNIFGIKKNILIASEIDISGKATHLIVNICKKLNASVYLSGIHGKDYLDMNLLNEHNIKVIFQRFHQPVYTQVYTDTFVPNLSIFDMLLNCGADKTLSLLMDKKSYELL